jgi:hypothetical protein
LIDTAHRSDIPEKERYSCYKRYPPSKEGSVGRVGSVVLRDDSTRAKYHRGVDLISDVLPFGRLWYGEPDHAIRYAMHSSRSHDAVSRVYDAPGNVVETHEHKGDFKDP